jgi:transcriptional regulator of acetoin/glycerol metabolism
MENWFADAPVPTHLRPGTYREPLLHFHHSSLVQRYESCQHIPEEIKRSPSESRSHRAGVLVTTVRRVRVMDVCRYKNRPLTQGYRARGHDSSPRRKNRFVALNCAAIPSALLESELFGHEKGAFTGAVAQAVGRFQAADRGTLFLDEIGDLPLELQPELLRALQEKQFERLGGGHTFQVDVRVIAATNQGLAQMVEERKFRADLYCRLNVFPITLPPLRERRNDIPMLVKHFVQKFAERQGKSIDSIPDEVMNVLKSHDWPGNIRELQNVIERGVIMATVL